MKSMILHQARKRKRRICLGVENRGFTFIELVIGMAISFLVLAAIFQVTTSIRRSYILHDKKNEVQQSARAALDYMGYFIRQLGLDPLNIQMSQGAAAAPGILSFSPTMLEFNGDCQPVPDGNPLDSYGDHITFSFSNNTLWRTDTYLHNPGDLALTVETEPIIHNVQSFEFHYYDGNYPRNEISAADPLAVPPLPAVGNMADIRVIRMELVVTVPAALRNKEDVTKSLSMEIRPRNLGAF